MTCRVVRTIVEALTIDARPAVALGRAEVARSVEAAQVWVRIAEGFAVEALAAEGQAPALRIAVGMAPALERVTTSQMSPHNEGILPACRSPRLPSEQAATVVAACVVAQWRTYPRLPIDLRTDWRSR